LLWKKHWRYRLWAARDIRVHRTVHHRRLYLGRRPGLARQIQHHRVVVAKRPALRHHVRFVHRHPTIAKRVVQHRRWVDHSRPHVHKPLPKKHPVKPPPKPKPPKKRRVR
jgi:hypothetical protein